MDLSSIKVNGKFFKNKDEKGREKISHIGIGAHPDDIEFMAFDGISKCYKNSTKAFAAVICSDGAGSSRSVEHRRLSTADFVALRAREQLEAAEMGEYAFTCLLAYKSAQLRGEDEKNLVADLAAILRECKPKVIYTHNPFDKHPTHVLVFQAVVRALQYIIDDYKPDEFWGCELWRGLDWLRDDDKKCFDVSRRAELARRMCALYQSQIFRNKRYDEAVEGRKRANASFFDFKSKDAASHVIYGIDLKPLIHENSISIVDFIQRHLDNFKNDVMQKF